MKLSEAPDWKALHFPNGTIITNDRDPFPEWWTLLNDLEVSPTRGKGHYKVIERRKPHESKHR